MSISAESPRPGTSSGVSSPISPPPISSFNFIKRLSSGAFGTVYLARKEDGPVYAIKVLQKKDLIRKNLTTHVLQERSALVGSHKNDFCVKLFYSLQSHDQVYFVMEYCAGGDLKSLLAKTQFFSHEMAGFYVAEVACALNYLHSKGIIHRDIKPDNMLIDSKGHVKLTDFGLSDVGYKNKLVGSPLVGYTPGMVASLGQNLTFSICSSSSSTRDSLSINMSNASSIGSPASSQPIQHSTPFGSLAGTVGHVPLIHTKHRKVRIPLRKLGSRSALNNSSTSSSSHNISTTSSFGNSSWCIIDTPPPQTDEPVEPVEPDPQPEVKRVKLSATNPVTSSAFSFDDSSFLSYSFDFLNKSKQRKPTPPTSLPVRLPATSSPLPLQVILPEEATTPTGISHGNSAFHSNMFTPPDLSPVCHKSADLGAHSNHGFADHISIHETGSPEQGRFRTDHSHLSNNFISLPVLHTNNKDVHLPGYHYANPRTPIDNITKEDIHRVFFDPNPKSPTWPTVEIPSTEQPKKRKLNSENPVEMVGLPGTSSTGLTADVSALLLGMNHTPPCCKTINESFSTPNSEPVRLLGTPDYLAPELIKLAMNESVENLHVTGACDWWSLGVCYYEFLIGVLPFNDDSPQLIFKNILRRKFEYPDDMDERQLAVLNGLICMDPDKRFSFEDLKKPEFLVIFGLQGEKDWDRLHELEVPWVPIVSSETDTAYFDDS